MKSIVIVLTIVATCFGLFMDTQMWNMVMPTVFSFPKLTYLEMFLACLAMRYIFCQEYTVTILWGKYYETLSKEEMFKATLYRFFLFFSGQTFMFFMIKGILYVAQKL